MSVDPITVELLRNRIASVMQEMDYHFYRSGYSTIVRESRDFSCVIVAPDGRLLVSPWMFFHSPVYYHLVNKVKEIYGEEDLVDGDVFVTNHPYDGNMPHASDMGFIAPIFYEKKLVAFVATIAHKADVGGTVPGSTYGSATELYHEGMMLPPIRIHSAGKPVEDIFRLISANTRAPYVVLGDISGQIGVTRIGGKHIKEMCRQFGPEIVLEAMEAMITASGEEFSSALKGIPDGTSEATGFLDHDGVDESQKIKLHVQVINKNGKLNFDFTGCDPETRGPVNLRIAMVEACVYYCLIGLVDSNLRYSDSIRELITLKFAERSVVSAKAPRPCSSYMKSCLKLCDVIIAAMDSLIPGRAIAHSGGSGGSIIVAWQGDTKPKRGNQYEIFGSAYGGGEGTDGASGASVMLANLFASPVEIIETEFPCRIRKFALNTDSGGPGTFRGGLNFVREYEMLEPAEIVYRADRAVEPPSGLRGGMPGGRSRFVVNPDTPNEKVMPSSARMNLPEGTVFRVNGPGGGGYGDPKKRDPNLLSKDIAEGFVTKEAAQRHYGWKPE